MGKELVISASRHETKVAILEDDQLVEVYFQRPHEYSLAGSIHKGRVTRVLPGMQSAFVDIGLERDAFLYVSDFFEEHEEYDRIAGVPEDKSAAPREAVAANHAAANHTPSPVEPAAPAPPPDKAAALPATGEEQDGRDHRNRRSRRRRNRGRGFPDSKYASDFEPKRAPEFHPVQAPEAEAEPQAATAAMPAESPMPVQDFLVLPGESLAKHRRGEELPIQAVSGPDLEDAPEPVTEPFFGSSAAPTAPEPLSVELPAVAPQPVEEVAEAPSAEIEREPDVAPAPLSAGQPVVESLWAPAEAEVFRKDDPADAAEALAYETVAAVENRTETAEPGDVAVEPPADEVSEDTASAASEIPEDGEPPVAGQPDLEEGVEPARMPVSLTATLREQGQPRFLHRVSRRMRRKMRGGGPGEGREEQNARRPESPAEARVESVEPKPDQPRTFQRSEKPPMPSISQLLKEGQEILVQIAKEPLGQKGARITSHIALPGRFVVFMPTVEHLGVSRKIASDEERLRLKRILLAHRAGMTGGFIVRTAGEGQSEADIAADMTFLYNLWLDLRQKAEKRPAPALIHHDLDLVQRLLRDQMAENFKAVWCDNEENYESVVRFVQRFQPALAGRVRMYTRATPIFDAFNVTAEMEKALRPKVWLKSGGHIVINQTEALVAIDINTGKFVGKSNRLEDTIVKTNTEAIKEIVRQIRLRDLGGIIVIDFIDMDERKSRQKVMQALEEAMRSDRAPNKILQFNDFGLVAITRKRVKQSLERTLCSTCPYCEGAGYVKSVQTVVTEILQEAHKIAGTVEGQELMLRVNPEVAKLLKSNDNTYLEELEEILGRSVLIKSDPALHQEKFDLV